MERKKPNVPIKGGDEEERSKQAKSSAASGRLWNSPDFGLNFSAWSCGSE